MNAPTAEHVHSAAKQGTLIYARVVNAGLVIGLGALGVLGGFGSDIKWLIAGGLFLAGVGVLMLGRRRVDPSVHLDEGGQGMVWWATIPYEDGKGAKDRPLVETGRYLDSEGVKTMVGFALTSQSKRAGQKGYLKVDATKWDHTGRHKVSYINTNRIVKVAAGDVRRKGGALGEKDERKVLQRWLPIRKRFERSEGF